MKDFTKKRILITGGHLTPAIAVISELKKRGFTNFVWVGHKKNQKGNIELSAEFLTIKKLEIPFVNLKTGKLSRTWSFATFFNDMKNLCMISAGIIQSSYIIFKYRPSLILSFGGYLAVPVVLVGKILGTKVITHEQTLVTGLANRIISKFADKILISWETSSKFFNTKKNDSYRKSH